MIPRVKPEGMLFGKPLHTFPDHALGDRSRVSALLCHRSRGEGGWLRHA
jgi:hypothetical protein